MNFILYFFAIAAGIFTGGMTSLIGSRYANKVNEKALQGAIGYVL